MHRHLGRLVIAFGRRHWARLVMCHFPTVRFAQKIVGGDQKGAIHFLEADDKGAIALHEDLGPAAGDRGRAGICQDAKRNLLRVFGLPEFLLPLQIVPFALVVQVLRFQQPESPLFSSSKLPRQR